MRAIVYTENGDPDVLQLVERPDPRPGPGEVRVRLAFSGVNPTDWKRRRTAEPAAGGQTPNQMLLNKLLQTLIFLLKSLN